MYIGTRARDTRGVKSPRFPAAAGLTKHSKTGYEGVGFLPKRCTRKARTSEDAKIRVQRRTNELHPVIKEYG